MIKKSINVIKFSEWVVDHRWWLVAVASLGVFFFEFLEYQPFQHGLSSNFFFEIIFYALILPTSVGIALSGLAASRSELAWSTYYQNLKRNLDSQLYNAHAHADLASVILQFVKVVMPLNGASLYKYDQDENRTKTILDWSLNKHTSSLFTSETCPCLDVHNEGNAMILKACVNERIVSSLKNSSCFCLPFIFSDNLVGGARLYFPADDKPSQEHVRLLNEVAPEIASAFHRIQLERIKERHNDSINAEQKRIARDVHDTLGHSLAYLRLRLGQITMEYDHAENDALQKEVATLRDVAKDAYDQMRDVLIMLSPNGDANINEMLGNYVEKFKEHANFELALQQHGKAVPLSPIVRRNLFYILKETLTNIEKHANAMKVEMVLNWGKDNLLIDIKDDGVGFDSSTVAVQNGHFGLTNMRERALESKVKLTISSQVNHGTLVQLQVPY